MFKKILFCTDFSATAENAFKYAVRAAEHNSARLFILHVMPEADAQFWKGYVYEEGKNLEDKALTALREKVAETYIPRIPEGVEYETAFRVGSAAQQILDYADEIGAELVVIGRQGNGGVRDLFFGNVAAKVAKSVKCPALIVP